MSAPPVPGAARVPLTPAGPSTGAPSAGTTSSGTAAPGAHPAGRPGGRLRRRLTALPARLVLAAVSGVLLVPAFPGYDLWPVAPVAVAGLAVAVHGRGGWAGALLGAVFGVGFFVPVLSWSGVYVGSGPWLLLAGAEAAFTALLGAAAALAGRLRGWPLAYAALWVADEALRDRVPFGGFPWARLAFSQAGAPTLGLASLGGAPAVTFVVALAGGLLAAAVLALADAGSPARILPGGPGRRRSSRSRTGRSRPRPVLAAAALVAAVAVTAAPLLVPRPTAGQPGPGHPGSIRVALVQGNVDRAGLTRSTPEQVLDNHLAQTDRLAAEVAAGREPRPDLVLWPENASDIDLLAEPAYGNEVTAAVRRLGAPIVVGAILDGSGAADTVDPHRPARRNAMIVWTADGPDTSPEGLYVKRLPVPFGEYIPLRSLARRVSSAVDLVPVDMTAGTRVGSLHAGGAVIGPAICFEVAFDGILRDGVRAGADLLAVPTNNSTFGHTDESVQQLAMSRLRAVEHGRAVLHASTVGVSAIVTPDGVAHGRTELFTPAVVTGAVPLRTSLTVADRVGAWPELVVSVLGAAAALAGGILARRGRRRPRPDRRQEESA